eukprot:TRINITY_DN4154_c0_g1_i3.p1 TRINITY_DN4154_c0_g1~~TRINITY_DN4154_c0_g1_i3.p1  ORF type:complete len:731 (+),score=93.00 TRINITY_DN4154_c0_g1_i3:222-2414(+)
MSAAVESETQVVSPPDQGVVKTHVDYLSERKPYYERRIQLFEQYFQREVDKVNEAKEKGQDINVILPDGKEVKGIKGVTTPFEIAESISKSLAKKVVIAQVDGVDWDMFRPMEGDCSLKLFGFETPEGREAYWHSSAHVLGQALELEFGVDLTIGPALEEGFYYDCYMGERTLGEHDKPQLAKRMEAIAKEAQPFQRIVVSRDEALSMFQENKFKLEIIGALPEDATISVYRCGPMVDLCHGPHLPNTSLLKAMAVNSVSRAFWRGDVNREPLMRVYGITFPDKKLLKEYQVRIEEAKKRDHRLLGTKYELFFFHPLSPGSCFFLPHGARVYQSMVKFMREKYWEYDYEEVLSPNIYNFDLWKTSGHAEHYKQNMFCFDIEKQQYGLKPMNCPGHCLMFANRTRSYRELPLRLADFGVLHRNEYSGALHGLTRVRRFQQDDAHIFCRPDQVMQEVSSFLKMLSEVYGIFGLEYTLALSTRPEGYLGELELWNKAEESLQEALKVSGKDYKLDPGEGAFYGPKIDITVFDALGRKFQCATVQLDFQLPIRFGLEYMTEEQGIQRPVIVHRAILGSVERMFAILTEHFAGKWPLWLSPRQVMIVPISESSFEYGRKVRQQLKSHQFFVDIDVRDFKMQKKVREAQIHQYNYILVVGEQEREEGCVNVRTRDNVVHGKHDLKSLIDTLLKERDSRSLGSMFKTEHSTNGNADNNVTVEKSEGENNGNLQAAEQ